MNDKLKSLAARGGAAFLSTAPKLALGGLRGTAGGFLAMGALGVALAVCSYLLWMRTHVPVPWWLEASLFGMPALLAAAGLYVGAVRGVLGALARAIVERRLLVYLYAQVKPAIVGALREARGKETAQLAEAVRAHLQATFDAEKPEVAPGFAERLARFITLHSRRVLALTMVAHVASAKSGADAVAELEKLSVEKLEHIVVGQLEALFSLKLTLITGGALLISVLPQAAWWLTR